jgi:proline dehydrogenase
MREDFFQDSGRPTALALEAWLRRQILRLADHPGLRAFVTRHGRTLGAYRFVAGDSFAEAVPVLRALNQAGLKVTLDALGESVTDRAEAEAARDTYLAMLDGIRAEGLDATVSLKLTQMGLDLDRDFCLDNVRRIVARAAALGNFVQIDMEDSAHTQATLRIFETLRREYDSVGIVLQAYLYRTKQDLQQMAALGASVRIVKGAYMEPPSVAFPQKADVDRNYVELCKTYLKSGNFTAIATHDTAIIAELKDFIAEHHIPRDRFEFQMLYGIRGRLQRELVAEGYPVRVYVPVGRDWYPYFMRRLAERPANLLFFLRNLVRR